MTEKLDISRHTLELSLKNRVLKIVFIKKDGSERTMFATRSQAADPQYQKKTDRVKKKHDHLLSVIDIEIGQWRTINIDNIISAEFTNLKPDAKLG